MPPSLLGMVGDGDDGRTTRATTIEGATTSSTSFPIAANAPPAPPVRVFPAGRYDRLVEEHGRDNVKLIFLVRHAEGTHNVDRDYQSAEQLDARLTPLGVEQCEGLRREILLLGRDERDAGDAAGEPSSVVNGCRTERDRPADKGSDRNMAYRRKLRHLVDTVDGDDICVVTSTMTRCIQTALLSFGYLHRRHDETPTSTQRRRRRQAPSVPFVALDALRETVNYTCDRRRSVSELAAEFPQVDFSHCMHDGDAVWDAYQERIRGLLASAAGNNNNGGGVAPGGPSRTSRDDDRCWDGHLESAELHAVARRGREALDFLQRLPQSRLVVCTHSAYLRCVLNWGQSGGVPRMMEQRLDDRSTHDARRDDAVPLFDYGSGCEEAATTGEKKMEEEDLAFSFEDYMREDYANAELRSFCLLVRS